MQFAWVGTFFIPENISLETKCWLSWRYLPDFRCCFSQQRRGQSVREKTSPELFACGIGLGAVAMCSAFYLLSFEPIAQRPALLFSYLFIVDLGCSRSRCSKAG